MCLLVMVAGGLSGAAPAVAPAASLRECRRIGPFNTVF